MDDGVSEGAHPPRILYSSIFAWYAVTGGRFLATFLEHEAGFSDTRIATTFALKALVQSCASVVAGPWADHLERTLQRKHGRGRGRMVVVFCGVFSGTVLFSLHGMHRFCGGDPAPGGRREQCDALFTSPWWHATLQLLYASSRAFVGPVVDGITLEYLKVRNDDNDIRNDASCTNQKSDDEESKNAATKNFGKERIHGAIWWAIANLILGPSFDAYGFSISYPYGFISALFVFVTMVLYLRGLDIDYAEEAIKTRTSLNGKCSGKDTCTGTGTETGFGRNKESSLLCTKSSYSGKQKDGEECEIFAETQQMTYYGAIRAKQRDDEELSSAEDVMPRETLEIATTKIDKITATTVRHTPTRDENVLPLLSLLRIVLGTVYGASFFFTYFCLTSGTTVVENLVFLYFEFLGGSNTLCAITVAMTVLFEIPIFQIAPELLKRFGSSLLMIIAGLCYIIRVIGYTLVPNGRSMFVLFLEPLHGVTFACAKLGAVEYVAQLMPLGYEASGQGILSLSEGAGSFFGLILSGIAEDRLGRRMMYRLFAMIVSYGIMAFGTVVFVIERR